MDLRVPPSGGVPINALTPAHALAPRGALGPRRRPPRPCPPQPAGPPTISTHLPEAHSRMLGVIANTAATGAIAIKKIAFGLRSVTSITAMLRRASQASFRISFAASGKEMME